MESFRKDQVNNILRDLDLENLSYLNLNEICEVFAPIDSVAYPRNNLVQSSFLEDTSHVYDGITFTYPSYSFSQLFEFNQIRRTIIPNGVFTHSIQSVVVPSRMCLSDMGNQPFSGEPIVLVGGGALSHKSFLDTLLWSVKNGLVDASSNIHPILFTNSPVSSEFGGKIVPCLAYPPGWWAYTLLSSMNPKKGDELITSMAGYVMACLKHDIFHISVESFPSSLRVFLDNFIQKFTFDVLDYFSVPFISNFSKWELVELVRKYIWDSRDQVPDSIFNALSIKNTIKANSNLSYQFNVLFGNRFPETLDIELLQRMVTPGEKLMVIFLSAASMVPTYFTIGDLVKYIKTSDKLFLRNGFVFDTPDPIANAQEIVNEEENLKMDAQVMDWAPLQMTAGRIVYIRSEHIGVAPDLKWHYSFCLDNNVKFTGISSKKNVAKWVALHSIWQYCIDPTSVEQAITRSYIAVSQDPFTIASSILDSNLGISCNNFVIAMAESLDPEFVDEHRMSVTGLEFLPNSYFFRKKNKHYSVFLLLYPASPFCIDELNHQSEMRVSRYSSYAPLDCTHLPPINFRLRGSRILRDYVFCSAKLEMSLMPRFRKTVSSFSIHEAGQSSDFVVNYPNPFKTGDSKQ